MKSTLLLPFSWKLLGWIILIPSFSIGCWYCFAWPEWAFLDVTVFGLTNEINGFADYGWFKTANNNVSDELLMVLTLVGAFLVAFTREKKEDELVADIRLNSLLLASYINCFILLFCTIFFYGTFFIYLMAFLMYSYLLIFIVIFQIKLWRYKRIPVDEE